MCSIEAKGCFKPRIFHLQSLAISRDKQKDQFEQLPKLIGSIRALEQNEEII